MRKNQIHILSVILVSPLIFFLIHHYFYHNSDLFPTGITQDENVLYISYAHQYLDEDSFSFYYSNPFNGNPNGSKIYLQPVNFIFVALMKAGIDPGLIHSIFGLIAAFICINICIHVLNLVHPVKKLVKLTSMLFIWGGGLTGIGGLIATQILPDYTKVLFWEGMYIGDPSKGWWGMNLGRTFFIPMEAFYHALFFLCVLLVLKKKWAAALIAGFFLSISHPFTGIEWLAILSGWLLIEIIAVRNNTIPLFFIIGVLLTLLFHLWYYLIHLPHFPEHKVIFDQYSEGWTYSFLVIIPAYCLVGFLCYLTMWKVKPVKRSVATPSQRLFLAWAIISFLLSKHEWFLKPMQPIHFTRGYVWSGLFLFGLPGLIWLLNYFKNIRPGKWALVLFITLFLSDNILWLGNILRGKNAVEWEGHLTKDTRLVLNYIGENTTNKNLIVGNSRLVNYLINIYSPANSWVSHRYNTPDYFKRLQDVQSYLSTGTELPEWNKQKIMIVLNKKIVMPRIHPSINKNKVYENETYEVFIR